MSATLPILASSDMSVDDWDALIDQAIHTDDPHASNFRITHCHYLLSRALHATIGLDSGANFHSWAVWGSRKAGVTIRMEDKDQASRDATLVAAVVGLLVGLVVGWMTHYLIPISFNLSILIWMPIGAIVGGYCGYLLAGYTRRAASRLILHGNRIVLADIGRVTARYLNYASNSPTPDSWNRFLAEIKSNPTPFTQHHLLKWAFEQYESARTATQLKARHEATYFANILAIFQEHILLQPHIRKSLPFLISKCVTARLLTYSIGEELLAVHEDVPPLDGVPFPETLQSIDNPELCDFLERDPGWCQLRSSLTQTRAADWTDINQRMTYIVTLFRSRHLAPEVTSPPYSPDQLASIAQSGCPDQPR